MRCRTVFVANEGVNPLKSFEDPPDSLMISIHIVQDASVFLLTIIDIVIVISSLSLCKSVRFDLNSNGSCKKEGTSLSKYASNPLVNQHYGFAEKGETEQRRCRNQGGGNFQQFLALLGIFTSHFHVVSLKYKKFLHYCRVNPQYHSRRNAVQLKRQPVELPWKRVQIFQKRFGSSFLKQCSKFRR